MIDATQQLSRLEAVLQNGIDLWGCHHALSVLRRWSHDEMLTLESRAYARRLLDRFGDQRSAVFGL